MIVDAHNECTYITSSGVLFKNVWSQSLIIVIVKSYYYYYRKKTIHLSRVRAFVCLVCIFDEALYEKVENVKNE